MYSPQDRIYNTPEVSVHAAQLVLQKIRVERVLRRIGYFSTCKSTKCSLSRPFPLKLPAISAAQTIKPFQNDVKQQQQQQTIHDEILPPLRQENTNLGTKDIRALGELKNKIKKREQTNKFEPKCQQKMELFQPFCPNRSPLKLPAIAKDKSKHFHSQVTEQIKDDDLRKHIEQYKKEKTKEIAITESVKKRKRRKKANMERYFQEWQEAIDKRYKRVEEDQDLVDFSILQNHERFHDVPDIEKERQQEQLYRNKISSNIKRSVSKKKSSFQDNTELVPVCDMIFEKKSTFQEDIYVHRKKQKKVTVK